MLPQAGHVRLEVLDVIGRSVAVLLDELKAAGSHEVYWTFSLGRLFSGTALSFAANSLIASNSVCDPRRATIINRATNG